MSRFAIQISAFLAFLGAGTVFHQHRLEFQPFLQSTTTEKTRRSQCLYDEVLHCLSHFSPAPNASTFNASEMEGRVDMCVRRWNSSRHETATHRVKWPFESFEVLRRDPGMEKDLIDWTIYRLDLSDERAHKNIVWFIEQRSNPLMG